MGKKVQIISEDPILSKNFKYEKRSKNKLIEKALNEEQKAAQLKKKKEMMQIQKKVDQQIDQITTQIPSLYDHNTKQKLKEQMFRSNSSKQNTKHIMPSNIVNIELSTISQKVDFYAYHFELKAKQDELVKQKRINRKQLIETQTKQQIRNMFASVDKNFINKEQEIEEQGEPIQNQVYNLSITCKKQCEISVDSQLFNASKNVELHKQILCSQQSLEQDKSLKTANIFIKSYFDHVFIENKQQQKIQNFRKIVIDHSMAHLNRSQLDQKGRGFTNCKTLILTPFIGDAKAIADLIESHFPDYSIVNKQKLEQFEDDNDFFRIGIKFANKKKQLTYFSSFDHSEIIIASPVGLKSIVGSQGDQKRQNSFISSVQLLYIDRASVLLMQNWAHVIQILKNINIMPRYESLKNSIDSIRDTFLELKSRLYRQTVIFSEFNFPELNALKANHLHNLQGIITSKIFYDKLVLNNVKVEQNFYKIEVKQPKDDLDIRFEYFKRKFWDDLHNKETNTKIVIFVNSYFQYVKLKSFMQKANASAQYICEHTSKNKVQGRLARFNNGQYRILLMTQRSFYFQICQVKKFHSIYFYSLPRNNFIYQELVDSLELSQLSSNKIISIYTRYDMLILEKIVGTAKALQMVREYCNNVSFVI